MGEHMFASGSRQGNHPIAPQGNRPIARPAFLLVCRPFGLESARKIALMRDVNCR
jgi:hypothetical protein